MYPSIVWWMAPNYGCTKPYTLRRLRLRLNVDAFIGPSAQTEFQILTDFFLETWVPALGNVTDLAVCG